MGRYILGRLKVRASVLGSASIILDKFNSLLCNYLIERRLMIGKGQYETRKVHRWHVVFRTYLKMSGG